MSTTATLTDLLSSALTGMGGVLPIESQWNSNPTIVEGSFMQFEMAVLIGIVGEVPGRFILNARMETFANVAQAMYGVTLEGAMLESFVGEIGNMIAGSAVSTLASDGVNLQITPPTVLVGDTKITGFHRGFEVPVELTNVGELKVLLIEDSE